MAISIGDAVLKVGVDKKDFDKKMTGIGASLKKHQKAIGAGMAVMGAAILAAGALSVKQFAAMGDEVQKMALRTGFSTEALSELRHAAELSGASLAGLEKASRTLSGAILDAGYGLETYVRSFDKIGLSYDKLQRLSPEDQFMAVMEALAGVTDESERAAIATDLFGRAGTQLLPMLVDGTEGLKNMRQEAHDLGIVFDQEAANKAAEFNDALTRLKGSMSGVMMEIGSFLIDYLKPLVDKITEAIKKYIAWAKAHPVLDKAIKTTVFALGGLLTVMGTIIVLRIPAIIAGFIAFGKVLLFTIVPAVWAFVTALWAQVTATLAALAATGVLIPAAIAAVAAIALLATGIILLVRNQRKQYDSTNAVTQATNELAETTSTYGDVATDAFNKATEATSALIEKTKQLTAAQKEGFGILRRLYPKGMTMKELRMAEKYLFRPLGLAKVGITALGLPLPAYQHGGVIPEPTLLTSLRTMRPYAVAGEAGTEWIGPMKGGYKTANIYIILDGRVLGRAVGQPIVDEIRVRAGLKL